MARCGESDLHYECACTWVVWTGRVALTLLACCTRRPAGACDNRHLYTLLYIHFVQLCTVNVKKFSARQQRGLVQVSLSLSGPALVVFFFLHVLELWSLHKLSFVCRWRRRESCDQERSRAICWAVNVDGAMRQHRVRKYARFQVRRSDRCVSA